MHFKVQLVLFLIVTFFGYAQSQAPAPTGITPPPTDFTPPPTDSTPPPTDSTPPPTDSTPPPTDSTPPPTGSTPPPTDSTPQASANMGYDPEYITFDGLRYKYDGPCSYLLMTNRCGDRKDVKLPLFEILTHHKRIRKTNNVVVIQQITVRIWNKTNSAPVEIELKKHNEIKINGKKQKVPYIDALMSLSKKSGEFKSKKYSRTEFKSSFGLKLVWANDEGGKLEITVFEDYNTCGLLGNNNGEITDDLQLQNGTLLPVVEGTKVTQDFIDTFGDSWLVHYDNEPLRCKVQPAIAYTVGQCGSDLEIVQKTCNSILKSKFKKLKGYNLRKCFSESDELNGIDATRIWDDCVMELCTCKQTKKECKPKVALDELKKVCKKNGASKFHLRLIE